MKSVKWTWLLLFFLLLAGLSGCDFREVLDDYPVSGVQIKLNWDGVTDKLPERMRVIFYPKSAEGKKVESYLPATGGGVKVPPGRYAVVIYNFNTECVQVRGEDAYETIEAYTGRCTGMDTTEEMVWSPDPFYVVALADVKVENTEEEILLEFQPESVVRNYTFEIKATGLKNVANIICNVSGMDGCYFMGLRSCELTAVPVHVETSVGNGLIKGTFSGFRDRSGVATRSEDVPVMMTLKLVKLDNTVQEIKVDITQAVAPSPPSGEDPDPGLPPQDTEIEIPLEEDIVIEDVDPDVGEGGGGIGGDVGDWDDETDVELPV